MHELQFIQDLATVMLVAGLTTVIFQRLRQPVVLGYIIAGVLIGPYMLPVVFIHNEQTIRTLSELGMIMLLFALGLEFNLKKLRAVGGPALVAALCEIVLMLWIGYEIGRFFGWRSMDSLFLGAMLSMSSTTIIMKALDDLNLKRERFAQLMFGILIIEDVLAIVLMALLTGIASTGDVEAGEAMAVRPGDASRPGSSPCSWRYRWWSACCWCRGWSTTSPGSAATTCCWWPCSASVSVSACWSPRWATASRWARS